jgi:hypothetical protein
MVAVAAPDLATLLTNAQRRAYHLEMRDQYVDGDPRAYEVWLMTGQTDGTDDEAWAEWGEMLAPLVKAGADIRRARIVSVPLAPYIRFEFTGTWHNLECGEQVRWVPRREVSDLALPGNDLWIVDGDLLFLHFSGEGVLTGVEASTDRNLFDFCLNAFERVWERGIDHADFEPQ